MTRFRSSWQTIMTDLALILFMVLASSPQMRGGNHGDDVASASDEQTTPSVAIYRVSSGVPVERWLRTQAIDPRQRLTVLVRGDADAAMGSVREGLNLVHRIETTGRPARLLFETTPDADLSIVVTYDRPQAGTLLAAP